jgi:hypothetical protein
MSALDVGARAIARGAQEAIKRMDENGISISKRNDLTAAALEGLALENPLLICAAGEQYTVDTAPYLRRQGLIIRGNGAELRNVNQTPLDVDHNVNVALPLGVSMVWDTPLLTYFAVQGANGSALTLPTGAGASFAPGDLVVLHGALTYPGPGNAYEVYRNYLRARIVEVAGDAVVLDRAPPAQLLADSPVIGNTANAHQTGLPGYPQYYLLYAPHISNLRIASDVGETFKHGGVIDGVFRDLTLEGRNGLVLNALQDCLFENIRFRAWRKICELSEGSYGTVVRNMRGSLTDASTGFGGAPDTAPFFIGISENCAECVMDDIAVDSGPNDTTGGAGVIFGAGRSNELRNSRLRFPALTAPALSIQTVADAGHSNVDCGFRDLAVTAPVCSQFFSCSDAGAGLLRPYLATSRFYGTPTLRAATLRGVEGRLRDNFFESGDVHLDTASTRWRIESNTINGKMVLGGGTGNVIRGNFIRDGFDGLTNAFLKANSVADNESDASRRLAGAAYLSSSPSTVTALSGNPPFASATFIAGDLKPGDKILVRSAANTSSAGSTHTKTARVSVTSNLTTSGAGSRAVTGASIPFDVDAVIEVISDTFLTFSTRIGDTTLASASIVASSLDAHGLTVNLEYWTTNAAEGIFVRSARIVAVKPGMSHPPID